jgi:hypothetical protein
MMSCSMKWKAAGRFSSQVGTIWLAGRIKPPSSWQFGGLLGRVDDPVHVPDQPLHLGCEPDHELTIAGIRDRLIGVAPRIEDELRVAVIGDDPGKLFGRDQVAHRAGLGLGKGPWAYVGLVTRDMAGGGDVEDAPHVAVVPVRIDADRAVRVDPAVLAPEPILGTAVFMAVRIHHRCHPDLASA